MKRGPTCSAVLALQLAQPLLHRPPLLTLGLHTQRLIWLHCPVRHSCLTALARPQAGSTGGGATSGRTW